MYSKIYFSISKTSLRAYHLFRNLRNPPLLDRGPDPFSFQPGQWHEEIMDVIGASVIGVSVIGPI